MTTRELDIATTASIMGERFAEQVYYLQNEGFIAAHESIAYWAIEFVDQYEETNWELVFENPESCGFPKEICCWDDAIYWFVSNKIKELKKY